MGMSNVHVALWLAFHFGVLKNRMEQPHYPQEQRELHACQVGCCVSSGDLKSITARPGMVLGLETMENQRAQKYITLTHEIKVLCAYFMCISCVFYTYFQLFLAYYCIL